MNNYLFILMGFIKIYIKNIVDQDIYRFGQAMDQLYFLYLCFYGDFRDFGLANDKFLNVFSEFLRFYYGSNKFS